MLLKQLVYSNIQHFKMILLLLLISSGSVLPSCAKDMKKKPFQINPALIPKSSCSTKSGYKFDWRVSVQPLSCATIFQSITVFYNGNCCKAFSKMKLNPSNDVNGTCCTGYEQMMKMPANVAPFILPLSKKGPTRGTPSTFI